jgi:hypothetical protein
MFFPPVCRVPQSYLVISRAGIKNICVKNWYYSCSKAFIAKGQTAKFGKTQFFLNFISQNLASAKFEKVETHV